MDVVGVPAMKVSDKDKQAIRETLLRADAVVREAAEKLASIAPAVNEQLHGLAETARPSR